MYIPLLYPLLSLCLQWTFRFLPCLGYCQQWCNERWSACILLDHVFIQIYAQEWDCRVICQRYFQFLRSLLAVLHRDCINLHSHQQCRKVSFSAHPIQHLLFVSFFDDSHSNWCEVVSYCSFNLHFSNNQCESHSVMSDSL